MLSSIPHTRAYILETRAASAAWEFYDAHVEGLGPRGGGARRLGRLAARWRRAEKRALVARASEEGGFAAVRANSPKDGWET
jgi:hypothetical protein